MDQPSVTGDTTRTNRTLERSKNGTLRLVPEGEAQVVVTAKETAEKDIPNGRNHDDADSLEQEEREGATRDVSFSRSGGNVRLVVPKLPKSLPPSRRLSLEDEEPKRSLDVWRDSLSNAMASFTVRPLRWSDSTVDNDTEAATLRPRKRDRVRSSVESAVEYVTNPFRSESESGTGSRLRSNPFRRMRRRAGPRVWERAASVVVVPSTGELNAALVPIGRQSWFDFLSVLLSWGNGWLGASVVTLSCLVSSLPVVAWCKRVGKAMSLPNHVHKAHMWLLRLLQNEKRTVLQGSGHHKYIYATGAVIAAHKAANFQLPQRRRRRPKRHSIRNGDWES